MFKEIEVSTRERTQLLDITEEVRTFLAGIKARSGLVTVFVPHTTVGVTINENADPDVVRDILSFTSEMVPEDASFRHSEGNSDAHIKSLLFGPSLTLIVEDGRPMLGTWQSVYFAEFDGPRRRRVWLKFVG